MADLSWPKVPNAEQYLIELRRGNTRNNYRASEANYKFTELSPSNEYTVKVVALSDDVRSSPAEKTFNTRPTPPRDVNFAISTNYADNLPTVKLSWKGNTRTFRVTKTEGNKNYPAMTSTPTHVFDALRFWDMK